MFEKSRLVLARKKRGYTQKALAEKVGLTSRHFNSYETGADEPPEQTLLKIADELKFPYKFFFGSEIEKVDTDYVSFRAFSKMTARDRDAAIASADVAMLISDWISSRFNLPEPSIPDLRGMKPHDAAEMIRKEWGLGDHPIKNIIHLLESRGVKIFSLTTQPDEIDAFCFWRDKNPFVFLNVTKSSERVRFDAAHELGHLVLHRHGKNGGREAEHEADKFASAFLMPTSSIIVECNRTLKLDVLIEKKKIWGVSVAALVHRLFSLGILTEWQYKQFFILISQNGYRVKEPNPIEHEMSQLLKKVIEHLKEENVSVHDLSKEINVRSEDINALLFGLVLTTIDGGGLTNIKKSFASHLKLIHSSNET